MIRNAFLQALLLSLLLAPRLALAAPAVETIDLEVIDEELRPSVIQRNLRLTALEDGASSAVLRFENLNPPSAQAGEYSMERLILLPEDSLPSLRPIEAQFSLIDDLGNRHSFAGDAWPEEFGRPRDLGYMVSLNQLGRFRGRRLGQIRVSGARSLVLTPGRTGKLHLASATFALEYSPEGSPAQRYIWPEGYTDPLGDAFLQAAVLNPSLPRELAPRPEPPGLDEDSRWVDLLRRAEAAGPIFRIRCYEPGLYRVPARFLGETGVNLTQFRPGEFRLYHRGRELPLIVGAPGPFLSTEDELYFYAPPVVGESPVYSEAFWLLSSAAGIADTPPLRIAVPDRERIQNNDITAIGAAAKFRLEEFPQEKYDRALSIYQGFTRWYWKQIEPGEYGEFEVEVPPVAIKAGQGVLELFVAVPRKRLTPVLGVYLNGERIGEHTFAARENAVVTLRFPTAKLRPGVNRFALSHETDHPQRSTNVFMIKGFRLEVPVTLEAGRGGFELEIEPPSAVREGTVHLPFEIASRGDLRALDITAPDAPRPLPVVVDRARHSYLQFDAAQPPTRIAFFDRDTARLPGRVERRPAPACTLPGEGSEYLIVYHPTFEEGARRLARWRRERSGFQTRLVDVEEFYDAFNYGTPSSQAIAEGLRYAASWWAPPTPYFVVLVGESSEYRGDPARLPTAAMPNFIPIYEIDDPSLNHLRGDSRYALLTPGDNIPELVVSRLSVATPEELAGQLHKIEQYEENPPVGPWSLRSYFVADDESEFGQAGRKIISYALNDQVRAFLFDQGEFPYTNLYTVPDAKRSVEATEHLLDNINNGAAFVNYFGHGGPNIWSHERLFHLSDIKKLTNDRRAPVITCSSCDNAWLDYPLPPVKESMGEILAKMPEGGAIAVFAPTAGGVTVDHEHLIQGMFEGLIDRRLDRIGDITLFSRIMFILRTGETGLVDQFVLLGDPATHLAIPRPAGTLDVQPAVVDARQGGEVAIRGTLDSPLWGWAEVAVKSNVTGMELASSRVRVRSGYFQSFIPLEAGADEASYNVLALAYNESRSFSRLLTGTFTVTRPRLEWRNLRRHVAATAGPGGLAEVAFPLEILNPSPFEIPSAEVVVRREGVDNPVLSRRFDFAPGEMRSVDFRYPSAPGLYALNVELRSGDGDFPAVSYPVTLAVRHASGDPRLALHPQHPLASPDILIPGRSPVFEVPIYNLGPPEVQQTLLRSRLTARLYRPDTGEDLSLPSHFQMPQPGGLETVRLNLTGPLELELPLALRVESVPVGAEGAEVLLDTPLAAQWRRGPDLSVDPGSIAFISEHQPPRTGETVFVRARVANLGDAPSGEFQMGLFKEVPWVAQNRLLPARGIADRNQPSLAPGESREVELRWDGQQTHGVHNIYVVANSTKRVPEEQMTNNAAFRQLRVVPHNDFVWQSELALSRDYGDRGDSLELRGQLRNDGDLPVPEVQVRARVFNGGSDPDLNDSVAVRDVALEPNETREVVFSLPLPLKASRAILEVNPKRDTSELDFSNNSIEGTVYVPAAFSEMAPVGGDAFSFAPLFRHGTATDMYVRPDGSIHPTALVLAAHEFHRMDPEYAVRVSGVDTRGLPPETDNQWTIEYGALTAHPRENAEPLRLSIPAGTGRSGLHHVRVQLRTETDYDGFPAGMLRARFEDETDFRTYDFVPRETAPTFQTVDLGVVDLVDGVLDMTVDDPEEAVWTLIRGFELSPVAGTFEAHPIALQGPRDRFGRRQVSLAARIDIPAGGSARFFRRVGRFAGEGALEWDDWREDPNAVNGEGEPFALEGDLLAWRIEVVYLPEAPVTIRDVRLQPAGASLLEEAAGPGQVAAGAPSESLP